MADLIDFGAGAATGSLDVTWINGADPATEPAYQIHAHDEHTVVIRQSKTLTYEAPFLYLLFGNDRAILFDTGAIEDRAVFDLRALVDEQIGAWLRRHPREGYELVVAHTHGHGDHVAGDAQLAERPATTVVAREEDVVREFFGFTGWPHQVVPFDLGGRVLEVTGIPGHHKTSIAVFDPWTGFLLTGDTVYPGRLYVFDMPAFVDSLDHLVEFAEARPVTHVLGGHVEMSRKARRDYPLGATSQPVEAPLPMTMTQLRAVREATHRVSAKRGLHVFDDFLIVNGMTTAMSVRLMLRGIRQRYLGRPPKA